MPGHRTLRPTSVLSLCRCTHGAFVLQSCRAHSAPHCLWACLKLPALSPHTLPWQAAQREAEEAAAAREEDLQVVLAAVGALLEEVQ